MEKKQKDGKGICDVELSNQKANTLQNVTGDSDLDFDMDYINMPIQSDNYFSGEMYGPGQDVFIGLSEEPDCVLYGPPELPRNDFIGISED